MDKKTNGGRLVVISGSFGYIGSALSHFFANAGYRIAALYRNRSEEEVKLFLSSLGHGDHKAFSVDLGDTSSVRTIFDDIVRDMGEPFVCIHAAGNLPVPKQVINAGKEDLENEIESNVYPSFIFLTEAARSLKKSGKGFLVGLTTANVVTLKNTKARGLYSTAKYAVQGMLVALREELLSSGVKVYSVAPGVLPGGMNEGTPKAFLDIVRAKTKNGELGTAQEIAEVILNLVEGKNPTDELTVLIAPETQS